MTDFAPLSAATRWAFGGGEKLSAAVGCPVLKNQLWEGAHTTTWLAFDVQLAQIGTRYARPLALSAETIGQSILRGRRNLVALARALELRVDPGTPAARLLQLPPPVQGVGAVGPDGVADDALRTHELRAGLCQSHAGGSGSTGGKRRLGHASQ